MNGVGFGPTTRQNFLKNITSCAIAFFLAANFDITKENHNHVLQYSIETEAPTDHWPLSCDKNILKNITSCAIAFFLAANFDITKENHNHVLQHSIETEAPTDHWLLSCDKTFSKTSLAVP
jgi:hypothetical protein